MSERRHRPPQPTLPPTAAASSTRRTNPANQQSPPPYPPPREAASSSEDRRTPAMPYFHRPHRSTGLAIRLTIALAALACPHATTAVAGTYTINGTCGLWDPFDHDP